MLVIHRQIRGKNAGNATAGDSNSFLQRIIIEVVTDNYRQMLAEAVTDPMDGCGLRLDPTLRANERGISGMFASAIGRVSSRYRAEARVDRPGLLEEVGDVDSSAGRVDYLAWYEHRIFGVELKAGSMSAENSEPTEGLQELWNKTVNQTQQVQNYLRSQSQEDKVHFPKPVSLALLVVIGRRKMAEDRVADLDAQIVTTRSNFINGLQKIGKSRRPQFTAVYTFPEQFRVFHPRRHGHADHDAGNTVIYTPYVAFLARSYVKGS